MKFGNTTTCYVIGEPYKTKPEEHSLIVNDKDTDCLMKIISTDGYSIDFNPGDIVWYDIENAKKYRLGNKDYVVILESDIITKIEPED